MNKWLHCGLFIVILSHIKLHRMMCYDGFSYRGVLGASFTAILVHHGTKIFSKIMGFSGSFYFFSKDCLIPLLEMDFMIQFLVMTGQTMDC